MGNLTFVIAATSYAGQLNLTATASSDSCPDLEVFAQAKRPDNYVGRIPAAIFTLGIYMFWWFYNQMDEPNKHFTSNWSQEDDLVHAVDAISWTSHRPAGHGKLPGRLPAAVCVRGHAAGHRAVANAAGPSQRPDGGRDDLCLRASVAAAALARA